MSALIADDLDVNTEPSNQKPAPLQENSHESEFFGGEVNLGVDVENTFDQQDQSPSLQLPMTATMLESRSSTTKLDRESIAQPVASSSNTSPSKIVKSGVDPNIVNRSPSGSISGVTNMTSAASPTPTRLHPIPPSVSPEYFKLPTRRMVDPATFTTMVDDSKIDDAIAIFYSGSQMDTRPRRNPISLGAALDTPDPFQYLTERGR